MRLDGAFSDSIDRWLRARAGSPHRNGEPTGLATPRWPAKSVPQPENVPATSSNEDRRGTSGGGMRREPGFGHLPSG